MIEGGCFCGAIRYEIDASENEYVVANCHCTICRRTSGAPYVTWLLTGSTRFRYTRGTPRILSSSDKGRRYFCEACGTPLVCEVAEHPDRVDITVGSLDAPGKFAPSRNGFTDTRLPWV